MRDLTMENPIRAIREISHDMTGRRKVRLANGREASALEIQQEYLNRARDFVDRRELETPLIVAGARPVGAHAQGGRVRRLRARGARDRLGHQVEAHRALPLPAGPAAEPPAHRPAGPRLPRHPSRARSVLPAGEARRRQPRHRRPARLRGQVRATADHPGPAARASSSGGPRSVDATSPSTGCTSSSTTRRSAPCCARTPSGRTTSGCTSSSRACSPPRRPVGTSQQGRLG